MARLCSENEFCRCPNCRVINGVGPAPKGSTLIRVERGLYESRDHRFIAREAFGTWEVRWVKTEGDVGSVIRPTLAEARSFVHHAGKYFVNVR